MKPVRPQIDFGCHFFLNLFCKWKQNGEYSWTKQLDQQKQEQEPKEKDHVGCNNRVILKSVMRIQYRDVT